MKVILFLLFVGLVAAKQNGARGVRRRTQEWCYFATTPFSSPAYVTFQGTPNLNAVTQLAFESTFLAEYNKATAANCDIGYRFLTGVTASLAGTKPGEYTLQFQTYGGYCSNCDMSPFSLFFSGFRRLSSKDKTYSAGRLNAQSLPNQGATTTTPPTGGDGSSPPGTQPAGVDSSPSGTQPGGAGNTGSPCSCTDIFNASFRPPSTTDFAALYRSALAFLSSSTGIPVNDPIISVSEVFTTPRPTTRPTVGPTPRPTPIPTALPTPEPTPNPTPEPTPVPTPDPTPRPTPLPSPRPTPAPIVGPTPSPTPAPTPLPTPPPTPSPVTGPTPKPTPVPTPRPSSSPTTTLAPSRSGPTPSPTPLPTPFPTTGPPTPSPTPLPTPFPTTAPPTPMPFTVAPSSSPSTVPTLSFVPSESPTTACVINDVVQPPFDARTVCFGFEQDDLLSFQDFEDGRNVGWNNAFVDQTQPPASNFTRFMGRFETGRAFPSRTWTFSSVDVRKFYVNFDFYEIDSWDGNGRGGLDRFLLGVNGDVQEIIDFGWFKWDFAENNTAGVTPEGIRWWMYSREGVKQIGFLDFTDQIHNVLVEVPRRYFETGKKVTVTIRWDLIGDRDEWVGIDNFKAARCLCGINIP